MDFRLSAEEEGLRKAVHEFVVTELIPLESEFANAPDIFEGSRWRSRVKSSQDAEIQRYVAMMEELEKKAAAKGLWHLDVPKEYGGLEVSNVALIAVTEELEKSAIPFELGNHVSNILYNCKSEQVDKYLWPCIRGEKTSAFGLSEPASGADPSMMQTTATPDGDYFIINGTKMFPTFADVADFVQLFARLPGTAGREGVTCFLIDTGTPGYRIARSIATIGGTEPCELVFEDCRVHKSQVVGEVGNGWALNQAWLGARRFQVGIRAHGKCQRVLRVVRELVRHEAKDAEEIAGKVGHFLGEIEALQHVDLSRRLESRSKNGRACRGGECKIICHGAFAPDNGFRFGNRRTVGTAQEPHAGANLSSCAGDPHRRRAFGDSKAYHSARAVSRRSRVIGTAMRHG